MPLPQEAGAVGGEYEEDVELGKNDVELERENTEVEIELEYVELESENTEVKIELEYVEEVGGTEEVIKESDEVELEVGTDEVLSDWVTVGSADLLTLDAHEVPQHLMVNRQYYHRLKIIFVLTHLRLYMMV